MIEKPFAADVLLQSIVRALEQGRRARGRRTEANLAQEALALLTPREREVFDGIVSGRPNKVIAFEMQISPRTVEIHRAHVMDKMKTNSLSDLVHTAMAARYNESK